MKAVKVTYTVKPEYVEQNKANIKKVMDALRTRQIEGMQYSSFTTGEGNTFVHLNMAKDQESLSQLNDLPEFSEFRMALKASGPLSPPSSEDLELVGAHFDV